MKKLKQIKVTMKNGDDTQVKVEFHGNPFTPTEFTSLFMSILESYTEGLLANNDRVAVFEHFNKVFGIFLNKILPESEIYKNSKKHKEFKEVVDSTLGKEETEDIKKSTEDNRFAAYLLAKDILMNEAGLDEQSVDVILNKRLGFVEELNTPNVKTRKES